MNPAQEAGNEVTEINAAIQLKNELVFLARDYVRWHARSQRAPAKSISNLLNQLATFVEDLQNLETAASRSRIAGRLPKKSADMRTREDDLRGLRESIRKALDGEFSELTGKDESARRSDTPGMAGRIEGLLSTPLLSVEQRKELLRVLATLDRSPPKTGWAGTSSSREVKSFTTGQWDRLDAQARLQKGLVRLADSIAAGGIALPAKPSNFQNPQTEKAAWNDFHRFGRDLAEFYRGLPARINSREPKWIKWIDFLPLHPKEYVQIEPQSFDAVTKRITIDVRPRGVDGDGSPNRELLPPLSEKTPISIEWEQPGKTVGGEITSAEDEIEVFAQLRPDDGKKAWASLSVDRYPRAFVFLVNCDSDEKPKLRQDRTGVQITQPRRDPVFGDKVVTDKDKNVRLKFRVEAPDTAFQFHPVNNGASDRVMVRIVGSHDLNTISKRGMAGPFFSDRHVQVRLLRTGPEGLVRVRAAVSDFEVNVSAADLNDMKARLLVELLLPSHGNHSSLDAPPRDFLPLVLDSTRPEIGGGTNWWGGKYQGDPVHVVLEAHDEDGSGIAGAVVGIYEKEASELVAKAEEPLEANGGGRWLGELSTKKLTPGKPYELILQVFDRAGNKSVVDRDFKVLPPRSKD